MTTLEFELKDTAPGTEVTYHVNGTKCTLAGLIDFVKEYIEDHCSKEVADEFCDVKASDDDVFEFARKIGMSAMRRKVIHKKTWTTSHIDNQDMIKASEAARREALKEAWDKVCNDYVSEFVWKHGYDIETELATKSLWVKEEPGTVAFIADMCINMDVIRYDIDNDIEEEKFEKWYWKSLEREETGLVYMNYPSFCQGCPDPITPEKEREFKKLREEVIKARERLEEAIIEYKTDKGRKCFI